MSIQAKIANARKAFEQIKDYTQEQADEMVYVSGKIIYDNAAPLARMAVDETGFGKYEHKIDKNMYTPAVFWDYLKDKKSVGIIKEVPELGLMEVAHPIGVIAAITPATGPTVTPLGNIMHALKTKNAIIVSPHPRAQGVSTKTVEFVREALAKIGAPKDLVQVLDEVSMADSRDLMEACDLVIATGSAGLTKAAYSSGTPAYGVGPGNPPVILDRDFDLDKAAEVTLESVFSDNGILCDGDNLLLYPQELESAFFDALKKVGIVVYDKDADVGKFRDLLFGDGAFNADMLGKDAPIIAKAAGFTVPDATDALAFKVHAIGKEEVMSHETMAPVVILKSYDKFEEAVDMAVRNMVESGGIGHTGGLFSDNKERIAYAAERIPVARLCINHSTTDAWGPPHNALSPAVSESCGTWGNNILAENVDFYHLLNISKVVKPLDVDFDVTKVFTK